MNPRPELPSPKDRERAGEGAEPLQGLEGPHRLPLPLRLTFLGQVFVYDQLPMSQVVQHGPKVGGVSVD